MLLRPESLPLTYQFYLEKTALRILLKAKQNHRIPEDLILDLLMNHFHPKEAERQLDTAISWGRYAELFSYDEPSGEIFLEESGVKESQKLNVKS